VIHNRLEDDQDERKTKNNVVERHHRLNVMKMNLESYCKQQT